METFFDEANWTDQGGISILRVGVGEIQHLAYSFVDMSPTRIEVTSLLRNRGLVEVAVEPQQ